MSTLPPPPPPPPPTHLILLTCHAIYQGPASGPPSSEASWLLAPFQQGANEHLTFISHVHLAASLLRSEHADALLVVSGGCTRGEVRRSEARGYFEVGLVEGVWGEEDLRGMGEGEGRIILEEGALDSFGNLLRGMIAFWRASGGTWPRRVSLVGFGFKRARFLGLHCRVLGLGVCGGRGVGVGERDERRRWKGKGRGSGKGDENGQGVKKGVEAFFRGVDPRFMDPDALEFDAVRCQETRRGEREYGYGEWERDLWGVGERLRRKRDRRDAWGEGKGKGNVGENGDAAAGRGTRAGERQAGRALFENDEERIRSGVRTRWLEAERGMAREEVLEEGVQMPWER